MNDLILRWVALFCYCLPSIRVFAVNSPVEANTIHSLKFRLYVIYSIKLSLIGSSKSDALPELVEFDHSILALKTTDLVLLD